MPERITVLYNGIIHTLNPQQPQVQALAIRNGRILAAGSQSNVLAAAAGAQREALDLKQRAVIPGLTDAHVHMTWYGITRQQVRLDGIESLETALHQIATRLPAMPPGAWVQGGGWNHTNWGISWPTRQQLDRVCGEHPAVFMRRDGHSVWVNSRALQLAGITAATPDPPGGQIQRDTTGDATGMLFENAMELVQRVVGVPGKAARQQALRAAIDEALSYGLTSLHIPPGPRSDDGHETLTDLQMLRERDDLPIRCLVHIAARDLPAMQALGMRSGLGDSWLRIGGLKIFADGSLGSQTAELLQPYEASDDYGTAMVEPAELDRLVEQANAAGISVIVHAIGDAANRKVLDAIERAQQAMRVQQGVAGTPGRPLLALPNRIEHVQLVHPDDLPRLAHLGIIASMQPIHATSDSNRAERLWGSRTRFAYALRSVLESGATLALGSDAPVDTINPWAGIHAAVTRQRPDDTPAGGWHPEQRLSLDETLRGYCIGPAIASGEPHLKGMLAPGMLADLVVLPADPAAMPPAGLHTLKADMTMIDGRVVWQKP